MLIEHDLYSLAKNDSLDFLTFPDTPTNTPCCSSQEDQETLTSRILIPLHPLFPCVPFPVLPFLLVYVMHQLRDSFGSLSPLSVLSLCVALPIPRHLAFIFLILPYFASAIAFTCAHSNRFFVFVNIDVFHFDQITSFSGDFPPCPLPICISLFFLPPTLSHLFNMWFLSSTCHVICLDWTSPLQLLTSLPSLIEWPLSYDHLSLLPLLFPLPSLSISLGGPAFLPGFSRPRCDNWRWRGRWWRPRRRTRRRRRRRSGNQRSKPQSLILRHFLWQLAPQWSPPPNCRPSLSTHSSSTS